MEDWISQGSQADSGSSKAFGDYVLIEKIGEGGMGVVFRARKLSLKKEVAVKFIKGGREASERRVAFFLREAELASQLDHPHIAPVYEVGERDGARYLVMRYIPGTTLAKRMKDPRSRGPCANGLNWC
ncbi:MAG: hypothetical protein FJ404_14335 [Verrucomicrobia bacterium]|nr:hypothetical protein [Verrucomicrobiota bacterium]